MINKIINKFDLLGILPHTRPNAIGMWPNEQECLVWSAMHGDPGNTWVEIGSFCGGSTILLGYAKENCVGNKPVMAIDAAFNPIFDLNIRRSKLNNIVKITSHSFDALGSEYIKDPIGFLFLDGYHSFRNVVTEFELAKPLLTDKAIVAFHDCSPNMWVHDNTIIKDLAANSYAYYDKFMTSQEEDFYIDEAIAYICVKHNYEIIDIPVRKPLEYYKETGLNGWVRGRTSPHNAFAAIRKIQ